MITVKNINGSPTEKPKGSFFGIHSDEKYFYFFESKSEADSFRSSIPKGEEKLIENELVNQFKELSLSELGEIKKILSL